MTRAKERKKKRAAKLAKSLLTKKVQIVDMTKAQARIGLEGQGYTDIRYSGKDKCFYVK